MGYGILVEYILVTCITTHMIFCRVRKWYMPANDRFNRKNAEKRRSSTAYGPLLYFHTNRMSVSPGSNWDVYIYIYIHRTHFIYAYVDSYIYIYTSCRYAWSFLVKPSISYGVIFYEQYALFWVCVCRCSKTEDSQMCTRSSINQAWFFSGYIYIYIIISVLYTHHFHSICI